MSEQRVRAKPKLASRPNLLDNWYFGKGVINQRRLASYINASGYCIDRWIRSGTALAITLQEDGLHVSSNSNSGDSLIQKFEFDRLKGKTLTLSCLSQDDLITSTFTVPEVNPNPGYTTYIDGAATHNGAWGVNANIQPNGHLGFLIFVYANQEATVIAAKLEEGDTQTLAYKENGKWVLNDPPPNPNQELAKCQVYQEPQAWHIAFAIPQTTEELRIVGSYFFKTVKPANPKVIVNDATKLIVTDTTTSSTITECTLESPTAYNRYMFAPRIINTGKKFIMGHVYRAIIQDNGYFIDANL